MGCSPVRNVNHSYPGIIHSAVAPIENEDELMEVAGMSFKNVDEDLELTTTVELSISCKLQEPCDCLVAFYSEMDYLELIGKTEVQKATDSPSFITTFRVTYSFEKQSKYRFDVYGIKHLNYKSLLRQNFLGSAKYSIHEIVCAPEQKLSKAFSPSGEITIYSEELSKLNHKVKLKLSMESKRSSGVYSIRLLRTSKTRRIPIYITEGQEYLPCSNN